MESHKIDYKILGNDTQLLVIELDPTETVVAEAGTMVYMESGIYFDTKMGDGSPASKGVLNSLIRAGKRYLTNESVFMTHFTNGNKDKKTRLGFAGPYPGQIIALDLNKIGGEVICQKDSFLCAALGTNITIAFTKKLTAGFFGQEGFILQRLKGDGKAFIHAGGTIVRKKLDNETFFVDTGCLVGFTKGVDYSIEMYGGIKSMIFGGEGVFLVKLSGTGYVWLQSLPFSKLADRVIMSSAVAMQALRHKR